MTGRRSNKVIFRSTFRCRSVNQSDLTDKVTQVLLFGWKYCSKYLYFSESALSQEPGPFSPGLEYNSETLTLKVYLFKLCDRRRTIDLSIREAVKDEEISRPPVGHQKADCLPFVLRRIVTD